MTIWLKHPLLLASAFLSLTSLMTEVASASTMTAAVDAVRSSVSPATASPATASPATVSPASPGATLLSGRSASSRLVPQVSRAALPEPLALPTGSRSLEISIEQTLPKARSQQSPVLLSRQSVSLAAPTRPTAPQFSRRSPATQPDIADKARVLPPSLSPTVRSVSSRPQPPLVSSPVVTSVSSETPVSSARQALAATLVRWKRSAPVPVDQSVTDDSPTVERPTTNDSAEVSLAAAPAPVSAAGTLRHQATTNSNEPSVVSIPENPRIAQSQETDRENPAGAEADDVREQLRIEPIIPAAVRTFPPNPNAGIPSAFGADWGDAFVSISGATADDLRDQVDGSISMGFGLGDAEELVGLELTYNILSIRNFAQNGSFNGKVHRVLSADSTSQIAAAVGWDNFANYGDDVAGTESSVYGIVTGGFLLQPDNPDNKLPLTMTFGLGGGNYRDPNADADLGVIAGVGVTVHPQLALNTAWSGRGLNLGASYVPFRTVPLTFNVLYGDVTSNTDAGSVLVLTIGYGYNFTPF